MENTLAYLYRYLRKVECSRYFSWRKIQFKEQSLVVCTKQSRQGDKASGMTRLIGQAKRCACFNWQYFAAVTNSTNKTKTSGALFLKRLRILPLLIRLLSLFTQALKLGILFTFANNFYFNYLCK
jgi:hypothetical protein